MPITNNLKTPIAGDTFRFDGSEWQLVQGGIGPVVGPDPSNAVPTVVNGEDGYQGGSLLYSRGDHRHELSFIGETKGDLIYFDGTNWNRLVAGVEGDVLTTHGTTSAPTWTALPILSTAAPINVDNSAASAGVSTSLSRSDHKHSTNTGVGISVGTVNNEGSATTLARSDHSHIVNDLNIPGQSSGKVLEFNGSNWVPATVSAVLGSAIRGQALIYDGYNWVAGGGLNLIDNYLASQNLKTDGYVSANSVRTNSFLSIGSQPATLGSIRLDYGSTIYGSHSLAANYQLFDWGNLGTNILTIGTTTGAIPDIQLATNNNLIVKVNGNGVMQLQSTNMVFGLSFNQIISQIDLLITSNPGGQTTTGFPIEVRGQNVTSGTGSGGLIQISGGDSINAGGNVFIKVGVGGTVDGNISLGRQPASYQSMSRGLFIPTAGTIPTGNPASGFYLYGNPSNNHPYIRTPDGYIVDLTNSGSLPSATHGQALIYDGSAWTAGGSGAIGSNYYFNKNLVTDGYISSDNLKARGSLLTIGDGSGSITYSATSSGTGHTFEIDGGFNLVIDNTSVRTTTDTIAYSTFNTNNQKYLTIDSTNVSSITAGTFNIQGQSATGTGSNGGAIQISAGGGGSGGKSGSIFLSGYNIGLIGSSVADGHGVIAVGNATTAPTTNPSSGHIYYSDSGLPTFRTSGGNVIKFDGTVTSTASLGSLTIPTLAQGYMTIVLGGTSYKIALYNT